MRDHREQRRIAISTSTPSFVLLTRFHTIVSTDFVARAVRFFALSPSSFPFTLFNRNFEPCARCYSRHIGTFRLTVNRAVVVKRGWREKIERADREVKKGARLVGELERIERERLTGERRKDWEEKTRAQIAVSSHARGRLFRRILNCVKIRRKDKRSARIVCLLPVRLSVRPSLRLLPVHTFVCPILWIDTRARAGTRSTDEVRA